MCGLGQIKLNLGGRVKRVGVVLFQAELIRQRTITRLTDYARFRDNTRRSQTTMVDPRANIGRRLVSGFVAIVDGIGGKPGNLSRLWRGCEILTS
jgi:hypothetical protein